MKKFKLTKYHLQSAVRNTMQNLGQDYSKREITAIVNLYYRFIENEDKEIESFYVQIYYEDNELQNEIAFELCKTMIFCRATIEDLFSVHRVETMFAIQSRAMKFVKSKDMKKYRDYCSVVNT